MAYVLSANSRCSRVGRNVKWNWNVSTPYLLLMVLAIQEWSEQINEVWGNGADCWGFRTAMTLQETGVFVGIVLEGKIPMWKDGEIVALQKRRY